MKDYQILLLCLCVHGLCWLFLILVRLDQTSRRERLEEKLDALGNRRSLP